MVIFNLGLKILKAFMRLSLLAVPTAHIPQIFFNDVVELLHLFRVVQGCHSVANLQDDTVVMFVNFQVKCQNQGIWICSQSPAQFSYTFSCVCISSKNYQKITVQKQTSLSYSSYPKSGFQNLHQNFLVESNLKRSRDRCNKVIQSVNEKSFN